MWPFSIAGSLVLVLLSLVVTSFPLLTSAEIVTVTTDTTVADCGVLIAGGSLASLAAALTAAATNTTLTVCFLEITDQPGGQLTASAVPAVDFGQYNSNPTNLPASFAQFMFDTFMPGAGNPGHCWVSKKCFEPQLAMDAYIWPQLARFPNLRVYLRTAVSYASTMQQPDGTSTVTSLVAIQRHPAEGTTGWEALLSAQIEDWYSPVPSTPYPRKAVLNFEVPPRGVVIEATEFGDVLATSGLPFAQGVEAPFENSTTAAMDYCGQAATIPMYISYGVEKSPVPDPVPAGIKGDAPWTLQEMDWMKVWSYRRSLAGINARDDAALPGETSNMNIGGGNDYNEGWLFAPTSTLPTVYTAPGEWRGGLNVTVLALSEQRAFAFYHFYKGNATAEIAPYLVLNTTLAGTASGLSKMPYLRDSRRSAGGLEDFRIDHKHLTIRDPNTDIAYRFNDTVALTNYFALDIHTMNRTVCPYPHYIVGNVHELPAFIPFRALTVRSCTNLLVAGKSMAQTFFANAGTRLHPEEWATGVAAAAAAVLMERNRWTSADMYADISILQTLLTEIGQPLQWTI